MEKLKLKPKRLRHLLIRLDTQLGLQQDTQLRLLQLRIPRDTQRDIQRDIQHTIQHLIRPYILQNTQQNILPLFQHVRLGIQQTIQPFFLPHIRQERLGTQQTIQRSFQLHTISNTTHHLDPVLQPRSQQLFRLPVIKATTRPTTRKQRRIQPALLLIVQPNLKL